MNPSELATEKQAISRQNSFSDLRRRPGLPSHWERWMHLKKTAI